LHPVRIWFDKVGDAKYISHLDLVRFFGRALSRAGIPAWYTEGFNPHPYLNFAAPLSLGAESENDCVDIKLEGDIPFSEMLEQLRSAMPREIFARLITTPLHPFSAIERALYRYSFSEAGSETVLTRFLEANEIVAEKKGKKGQADTQINIKEYMRDYTAELGADGCTLSATLPAGNKFSVNPLLLAGALDAAGIPCMGVRRLRLLLADSSPFA